MSEPTAPAAPPRASLGRIVLNRILGRSEKPTTIPRDRFREGLETIVFVVVLVFLLKQFVVEAFVIPTGSMAETLYGDHKEIVCPECGYSYPLNSHCEVEPSDGGRLRAVQGSCCPNCRIKQIYTANSRVPGNISGDRVLVLKPIYHREKAQPGDVVVFKFPDRPQKDFSAQNYIKRLWATGGQTLAIWRGNLFVCDTLTYPATAVNDFATTLFPRPDNPTDLWRSKYAYINDAAARMVFEESRVAGFPDNGKGFRLIRKNDVLLKEMQRIVYDNDFQSEALKRKGVPPRWSPESTDWSASPDGKSFTHTGTGFGWLRYRHLVLDDWRGLADGGRPVIPPRPIDNFLAYNSETGGNYQLVLDQSTGNSKYWVGDLIVECQADFQAADAEFVLELSKGPNRFQAIFKSGQATLRRTGPGGRDMAVANTPISAPGSYHLKFANVDCRLRVWVDGKPLQFEGLVDYAPLLPEKFDPLDTKEEGWVQANDVEQPVSIGAAGGVNVSKLRIWRDTYFVHLHEHYRYTQHVSSTLTTIYAHPGHYLCLGDNSAQSLDSRDWGAVPDRLMLGKAVAIFFPLGRIGLIK